MGVLRLPRLRTIRFHGGGLPDDRTWREGILSLKHRRCNETNQYHPTQQSPHENDRLPGNENVHGRTSRDEERLTITTIILRKPQDISWTSYPLRTGLSPSPTAGASARKPHPVAGFGCKVLKYLLGPRETLQDWSGSNLLTTRRFTRMAGRNSRYHHTLKRGLEQCSPTLKSATFSRSISSLRN